MDIAGGTKTEFPLIAAIFLSALLFFLTGIPESSLAQTSIPRSSSSSPTRLNELRTLADAQQWKKIIVLVEALSPQARGAQSADVEFYYGTALAQTGRLPEAAGIFQRAEHLWPKDARFPVELAGVEFKQKNYPLAAARLRHALRLQPGDAYTQNFLANVYFLEGNLPAALKHWNRIGKPHVVNIKNQPVPKVDPVLLDRAFAFSPASVLLLPDFLATDARLRNLNVFSQYSFALEARPDGNFDLDFRNLEKTGWNGNKWIALGLMLRGLPGQTVYPEFPDIRHKGFNFTSLYRWDKEKRRVQAELSGPVQRNPKEHFSLDFDWRNENWDIRRLFDGPAPILGSLNLQKKAVAGRFLKVESGRWEWSATTEFSHRNYRSVIAGTALPPSLLLAGDQLKETVELNTLLWNDPDHRFTANGNLISQTGSIWSSPAHTFEKLQASARLRWFPMSISDDYEVDQHLNFGKAYGGLPFDELWFLGLGGDNDLPMHGHIATRNGRKGSAPLGTRYFLSNWELDKNIHDFGLFRVQAGPLLDTGTMHDSIPALGSNEWLWDVGAQVKALAFGMGVALSYGKDLRSGNNAVYVTFVRK